MREIPFNRPHLHGPEAEYLQKAIENAHLSGDGHYTRLCHDWLEKSTGAKKALLVPSGTAALEMAALLINCKEGDEIIMPSFTFVSTANAFVLRGARPVFIDIRPDTQNIDEKLIEQAITEKTKAICVVHYAGVACEMDTIMDIATRHGLYVIEDAAQGVGATYKGRSLGSIGHLGCYSFHETKNLICGEGGALLINDERFIEKAEIIREKGTNRSKFIRGQVDKYTWVDIGSSYLPSELTAAYLYAQLCHSKEINKQRMQWWNLYHHALESAEKKGLLKRPVIPAECGHNAHIYYIQLPTAEARNALMDKLNHAGIHATFHYIPLHNAPQGKTHGFTPYPMPQTQHTADTLLRLPLYYDLEPQDCAKVLEVGFGINIPTDISLVPVNELPYEQQMQLREWRNSEEISQNFIIDHISEEQHKQWLKKNSSEMPPLAYLIKAGTQPLGLVYFPWVNKVNGTGEIGIYIYDKSYKYLRPASNAYSQAIEFAKNTLGLRRLYAHILDGNEKSIRLHERFGFTLCPGKSTNYPKAGGEVLVHTYSCELSDASVQLSIVATVYSTGEYLQEFCERCFRAAEQAGYTPTAVEMVLVIDGCPKNGLEAALAVRQTDSRIRIIELSRNFGHHRAMYIACQEARGENVFLIDSDLEESPEWLKDFTELAQSKKADMVYGVQKKRKGGWFEAISGELFYTLFNFLSERPIPKNMVTARLMTKHFVNHLLKFRDKEPFFFGLCESTGFKQQACYVTKVSSSPTTYTFRKKLQLAITSVISYSAKPLMYISYFGLIITLVSLCYVAWLISDYFISGTAPLGWPSIVASIWLVGGITTMSLGIIGIYISKIYKETKDRPTAIISHRYE